MDTNDKNFEITQEDNSEEIEFDENIDINALQAKLQEHMLLDNVEYVPETTNEVPQDSSNISEFSEMLSSSVVPVEQAQVEVVESSETVESAPAVVPQQQLPQEKLKLQPGEKKFVIYIEPENIDFIEGLSIKDRKRVINRVLHYEDEDVRRKKERKERAKFTNQVIIMVLTVVVSLPIFFLLLNKSIEMTIVNYQQAQQNFVKLYKEQGKIKSYKNFQRSFD